MNPIKKIRTSFTTRMKESADDISRLAQKLEDAVTDSNDPMTT